MSAFNFTNINECFLTIINELDKVMGYFVDKSREVSTDLSIKERREYTNELFDKMEIVDSYKADVNRLNERLKTYYHGLQDAIIDNNNSEKDVDNDIDKVDLDNNDADNGDFEDNGIIDSTDDRDDSITSELSNKRH